MARADITNFAGDNRRFPGLRRVASSIWGLMPTGRPLRDMTTAMLIIVLVLTAFVAGLWLRSFAEQATNPTREAEKALYLKMNQAERGDFIQGIIDERLKHLPMDKIE